MRKLDYFYGPDSKIVLGAGAGAHIDSCTREACILALEEQLTVEFVHNNQLYRVNYRSLLEQVRKRSIPSITS